MCVCVCVCVCVYCFEFDRCGGLFYDFRVGLSPAILRAQIFRIRELRPVQL